MFKSRIVLALGALAIGATSLAAAPAGAANSASYRDCSFVGGIDPDFVQLSGATASPQGSLTVSPSQAQIELLASESADPGDSNGADTATATVSAPNVAPKTVSGSGVGKVMLTIPLTGATAGTNYTIAWAATFDGGNHMCPSSSTPQNTGPSPFVLTVSSTTPVSVTPVAPPRPVSPKPAAKSKCHTVTRRIHGHRRRVKVCPKAKKKHAAHR